MNGYCSSCGGIIGRDCFNPQECAEITARMEHQAVQSSAYDDGFAAGKASALSVQKQLVEAAELLFVDDLLDEPQGENPMWREEVQLRLSALRAAILAAKASS